MRISVIEGITRAIKKGGAIQTQIKFLSFLGGGTQMTHPRTHS